MPRCLLMAVLLVLALSLPVSTYADGIIHKLPADGAWSKYDLEIHSIRKDGQTRITQGSYTIRSVGRNEVNDEMCRWIELEFRLHRENEKDFVEILQLVIPESHLVGGDNPLDHIVKGWQKYPNSGSGVGGVILDPNLVRKMILPRVLHGSQKNAQNLDPKPVQTKLREFKDCKGIACSQILVLGKKPKEFEDHYRYEARYHQEAPFGVVEFKSEFRRKLAKDQFTPSQTWILKLEENGVGAESSITEAESRK